MSTRATATAIVLPLAVAILLIGVYLAGVNGAQGTWAGACVGDVSADALGQCTLAMDSQLNQGGFQSLQDCMAGVPPGVPQSNWTCIKIAPTFLDVAGFVVTEFGLVVPIVAVALGLVLLVRARHDGTNTG